MTIEFDGQNNKITRDTAGSIKVDRKTSDGDIIELQKDGTTIGSIGSRAGVVSTIVLNPASGNGAGLSGGTKCVVPADEAGIIDNDISLGISTHRFKDAYLSGSVYLGGTGSANELDDYEEGTWIPIINPLSGTVTSSTGSGVYRKVGNLVTASFSANITGGTISFISNISGLPFTSAASALGAARENNATGLMWELSLGNGGTGMAMFTYANSRSASNGYGWVGSITYTTS